MKNELVVKDNALINASYNLEVTEQRLILLAIIEARKSGRGITSDSRLEIHASDYAKQFNVTKEASYSALKSAVSNLFNRQFSYTAEYKKTGKMGVVRSRWVSRIFYVDDLALLEITFAPDVVPLITRLEERFTSYQLKQVTQLTSKYAIRLYELLIAWREVGKTPMMELTEFRNKIGVDDAEYKLMHQFKSRVLEPAIKQINDFTDINLVYEQHKQGRIITGFSFKFKKKPQPKSLDVKRDPNTVDSFLKMTDAQLNTFSSKLADLAEVQTMANVGEDMKPFIARLRTMLMDVEHQKILKPYLVQVGFGIH